jgi:hypothetical protein
MKRSMIAVTCLLLTLGTALRASADVVTSWNSAALAAIRTSSTPPPVASRALAILHVSIYDAVNGISRRYEPSDALPGVTRSFGGFAAAAAEAGVSRIYGGIHYMSANQDGLSADAAIGDFTFANFLQPKGNRSTH